MSDKIDIELNNLVQKNWRLASEIDWEAERARQISDAKREARQIEYWLEVDKQQEIRNEFRANNIV